MTQSSLQTQCPKCQTRFRVTEEQLGVAKGKVRCGNCMNVFNAIEHQIMPGSSAGNRPSPAPSRPSDTASSGASEEDFVFADNPEEDAAEGRYAGSKLTFSDDELSDSFRSFDERDQSDYKDVEDDHSEQPVDESWAEAILDDEPEPRKPSTTTAKRARPDPEPEPEAPAKPEPSPDIGAELSLEEEPTYQSSPATKPSLTTAATSSPEGSGSDAAIEFETPERQEDSFRADPPFRDLRREPVAVDSGRGGSLRTVIWSLIVLALVGVLVAQVTWFQFDRLSAIPELRPFYEKGCELAGCELKPLIDVDAIQSRKLVVRTNPDNRSQLVVDAVIINRADFEQPFPAIALTFSNLNGDVVAQSLFTPEEYLAGEGKELETMPPETPVRIAINIRDPGRDAVNYNILFRPYAP
ncbi:MJ0042 family finger-like domain-containing protein [Marinobacter gudaonensis]|uniref:MJ0042 family finger-like domain-containing protein n=1 Tax=Marinobacter gudaonensis TaxID=375760 RepID=A0A1I6GWI0_9GAMM|nr:DUF3426 domain-containing protein [Marinobacter gudaonensis]SFR46407.1 MJ0042 family finger-like domain-containing protein [Marinobacter gudaonensis]